MKSWIFGVANTNEPVCQWTLEVGADASGSPEMVPTNSITGTVQNDTGVAGQNSPTPAEKIFARHKVLRYTDSSWNDTLFDPSYGKTYSDQAEFFSQSVDGFAQTLSTNATTIFLKIRKNQ